MSPEPRESDATAWFERERTACIRPGFSAIISSNRRRAARPVSADLNRVFDPGRTSEHKDGNLLNSGMARGHQVPLTLNTGPAQRS